MNDVIQIEACSQLYVAYIINGCTLDREFEKYLFVMSADKRGLIW